MANQNITLDELLTAMKGAKVGYQKTLLHTHSNVGQSQSGTIILNQPITNFDFLTATSGDNTDSNPDNANRLILVKAIVYKRSYMDLSDESNGTFNIHTATDSNKISYMFLDATTMKIITAMNNSINAIYDWKTVIEWGGVL